MKFTGHERDEATGLDYMMHRYYSPTEGRFREVDPFPGTLADPQSLNRYTYTRNNPVKFVDPEGLKFVPGGIMGISEEEFWEWCQTFKCANVRHAPEVMGGDDTCAREECDREEDKQPLVVGGTGGKIGETGLSPDAVDDTIRDLEKEYRDPKTSTRRKSEIQRRLKELRRRESKKAHGADKKSEYSTATPLPTPELTTAEKVGLVTLGAAALIVTIGTDVLSGGLGIADDAVTVPASIGAIAVGLGLASPGPPQGEH